MKGVKRVHPLSAEPPSESREGQGLVKETPITPRMKALTFQALLRVQRGTGIRLCWGGNKAVWENNKYFLSICLFFFFFLTVSYILLAYRFCHYVSHIYYIYLYISTVPLSREPRGLRSYSRMKSWWIFPSGLESLGGGQGVPSCPAGLSAL